MERSDIQHDLEHAVQIGELAGPLVHEFNNFLNTLLLQAAMAEAPPPATRPIDLAVVRRESQKIVKLIREWQQLTRKPSEEFQPCDVHEIVRDVHNRLSERSSVANLTLELAPGALRVPATSVELARLCSMLVQALGKGWPNRTSGNLVLRTHKKDQQAIVSIVVPGPHLESQALAELFDPARSVGAGLELSACKSLARRLQARLNAENQPDGSVAVVLGLAAVDP